MPDQVCIIKTGPSLESDAKRVYWPYKITGNCPVCGKLLEFGKDYMLIGSVTYIGYDERMILLYCEYCGSDLYMEARVRLDIEIIPVLHDNT